MITIPRHFAEMTIVTAVSQKCETHTWLGEEQGRKIHGMPVAVMLGAVVETIQRASLEM